MLLLYFTYINSSNSHNKLTREIFFLLSPFTDDKTEVIGRDKESLMGMQLILPSEMWGSFFWGERYGEEVTFQLRLREEA